ncbi:hypothetical protein [Parapedobacter composti]|uniref:hypothetical protein n=1 Tax=Parapedobacter composti TaxID=623281 RepID=UPI000B860E16|nr:hypothetical protein [Parapedobacter composti]
MNVVGGVGLVISALYFDVPPNLAANAVWVLIALFNVIRYTTAKRSARRRTSGDTEAVSTE